MTKLSKPLRCDQQWLEMSPTKGGRTCAKCQKTIVDFSRMSWSEIERVQNLNNNSLCGMYSEKQLENWGYQVPNACYKFAASTALFLSLMSAFPVFSQTLSVQKIVVHGILSGKTLEGDTIKLVGANVALKGTTRGTVAGFDGEYTLDITDQIDSLSDPTLIISYVGYPTSEIDLNNFRQGELKHDIQLNAVDAIPIIFYTNRPKLGSRIKWRFQKLFGRKEKRS